MKVTKHGKTIEKDTKAHRMRRMALDSATVDVLREHRARYEEAMTALGVEPTDDVSFTRTRPTTRSRMTRTA